MQRFIAAIVGLLCALGAVGSRASAEESALLSALEFPETNGNLTLSFAIATESRCTFGDFDAIAFEVANSDNPRMLFSIEPLAGENAEGVSRDISDTPEPKRPGGAFDVELPKPARPTLYGVFLCKDSDNQNSCLKKRVSDFGKLFRRYEFKEGSTPAPNPPDSVYFFRFLIVDGGKVYYAPSALTKEGYQKLEKLYAKSIKPAAIDSARKLGKTLESMPLRLKDRQLVLILPAYDVDKCGAVSPSVK